MNPLYSQYKELLALTQLFLLRECSLQEQRMTDSQTYRFFQKLSSSQASQPSTKRTLIPTPPPAPAPAPALAPVPAKPPLHVKPLPPSSQEPLKEPYRPSSSETPPPTPTKTTSAKLVTEQPKQAFLNLEPLPAAQPIDCQQFRIILKEHFPHYPLTDHIPSDQRAKKVKNAWQMEQMIPPILILSFQEQEKQLNFLKNVAEAITRHGVPARVISGPKMERDKTWDQILKTAGLQLIIASDYGLYLLPELMKHYKESPRQAKHFLGEIPLLLLSDLSLYLKEPQLKPLLWRAICAECESLVRR